jgi:hypothetical protein
MSENNKWLAEERVRNSTRVLTGHQYHQNATAIAITGIGGAITHALLDLSKSIQRVTDNKYAGLLAFADELAEYLGEEEVDVERARLLAERYARIRMEIDQF